MGKQKRTVPYPKCSEKFYKTGCSINPSRYTGKDKKPLFNCSTGAPPLNCPFMLCQGNVCIYAAKVRSENGFYVFPCDDIGTAEDGGAIECEKPSKEETRQNTQRFIEENPKGVLHL